MAIDLELAEKTISFLNSLVELDKIAVSELVDSRVLCNSKLADHPTVQVRGYGPVTPSVGLLGILNGLCGSYDDEPKKGFGPISAQFSSGKIVAFFLTRPSMGS